jgi:hypothetical protein
MGLPTGLDDVEATRRLAKIARTGRLQQYDTAVNVEKPAIEQEN